MEEKMELPGPASWEFEGPVDYIKQLARMREIPKEGSFAKRGIQEGKIREGELSHPNSATDPAATIDRLISLQGISPAATPKPVMSTTFGADVFSSHSPPPLPGPLLSRQNPPLPPGPPPLGRFQPPLPPGPPPPKPPTRTVMDFRKAAPVPDSIRAPPPPPVSVTAFRTPPPFAAPANRAVPTPAHPQVGTSMLDAANNGRTKQPRRPRGFSLSTSLRRTVDSYEKVAQVGGGTYGDVFKARDRETGDIVALKKVRLEDEKEGFPVTALREIKFLSQMEHENVVKLKEVVTSKASDTTRNKGSVFMVFEYAECDLVGLMKTAKLTEPHIMCIVRQILQAVHFAHVNHILHRDIKPSNVLVNSQGVVKLADWGLCRRWAEGNKYTNRVVTRWYRAPELLLGEQQYTSAIDMWAVGCLMAELLLGRALLPGKDDVNQLKLVLELCGKPDKTNLPSGWDSLPLAKDMLGGEATPSMMDMRFAPLRPTAKDLIFRMLELDPAKRISAKDALGHDWFWGDPAPCDPMFLPIPKGDGLHEFQLRQEAARVERKPGEGPLEKTWRHEVPGKHQ